MYTEKLIELNKAIYAIESRQDQSFIINQYKRFQSVRKKDQRFFLNRQERKRLDRLYQQFVTTQLFNVRI